MVDYEKFVGDLVKPLVLKPEELVVKQFGSDENISVQVLVDADDLGRVIGKKGRIANAIRTIAYACAAKEGISLEITIESIQWKHSII